MNLQPKLLIYDGSFEGFLTCIFSVFDQKIAQADIQKSILAQGLLFGDSETVVTQLAQSDRVWSGLIKKAGTAGARGVYYAFLSEKPRVENILLCYIQGVFHNAAGYTQDFSDPTVLNVQKIIKSVGREKHRMEAFIRFRLTKDQLYFATIAPDFDVLPLIAAHFIRRYADQQWVIYDLKRQYGLFYDLHTAQFMSMELPAGFDPAQTSEDFFDQAELEFQTLWQDYFKSVTIASRKNMKLHIQHVPKRYWKYLSEKQQ